MLLVKIFGTILLIYLLGLALCPKGIFLYEILRIPLWLPKLYAAPRRPMLEQRHQYGTHRRQYILEFAPPPGHATKELVIVYIHGGGWMFGSPEMFRANAFRLTQAGYRVFMPSHRRLPRHFIPHMRQDMVRIMTTIRSLMAVEGIGHWPVILGGSSSGGHLSALFAFDASLRKEAGPEAAAIHGLFLLGAPVHLEMMWHSPPLYLLAGRRNSDRFRNANPYRHLSGSAKLPVLIMHGENDGLVETDSVVAFAEKLKELNQAETRLEILPGGNHLDSAGWFQLDAASHRIFFGWLAEVERKVRLS
ncbi:MAG: alpha/beta hydrolase [Bacteroidetes bacterium]|nr:MAG: alpha/beta hydrolase [Bacteroidota bacterium]